MNQSMQAVKKELSPVLFYLFFFIYFLNLIFMIWVPANDYDTMSSYLARIKLEEFGSLKETATLEIQYLFPKFFDYLHAPFLKLGYFITLPNFLLFTIVLLLLIRRFTPTTAAWALIFLFFCPSVLLTITSAKNDISLGLIAFISWYIISYLRESTWYAVLSVLSISMLIGTKWHGIVLAAPLFLYFLWNMKSQGRLGIKKLSLALLFLPLFFYVSSAQIYLNNYRDYGTFFPRPDFLERKISLLENAKQMPPALVLDTLDPPYHFIQYVTQGSVVAEPNFGFGKVTRSLLYTTSDFNSPGILLLIVLLGATIALFRKNIPREIKISGLIGLFYFSVVFVSFPFSTWILRYFLAAYILCVLPTAYLISNFSPKKYQWLLLTLFIVFSLYAVAFNGEKRLVRLELRDKNNFLEHKRSIYREFFHRDNLYFTIWGGYESLFHFLKNNVSVQQSLTFVNFATGGDVPFLYPLIRDRQANNTKIINLRYFAEKNSDLNLTSDFVMTYRQPIKNKNYELIYDVDKKGCQDMCVFRRNNK